MIPFAVSIVLCLQQGIPARVVELEATVDGNRVGKVIYTRGIVAGKGMSRTTIFEVEEGETKYSIHEVREYDNDANPVRFMRTYREGETVLKVTVVYRGAIVDVTYSEGDDSDTESIALLEADAKITAPNEFWFLNKTPRPGDRVVFWEYDIDATGWVERIVTYNGKTDLKFGEKTIKVHRISVGKDINIYVDDFGMPYKVVDKTVRGGMTLVRTFPIDGGL